MSVLAAASAARAAAVTRHRVTAVWSLIHCHRPSPRERHVTDTSLEHAAGTSEHARAGGTPPDRSEHRHRLATAGRRAPRRPLRRLPHLTSPAAAAANDVRRRPGGWRGRLSVRLTGWGAERADTPR